MKATLLTILTLLTLSCNSQKQPTETNPIKPSTAQDQASQIGQYVVETFQDSKGNLWFGTLEKGVAQYDGATLSYLTTKDGLPSNRIVRIIEDDSGNLWFGTGAGLSKYDGTTFTNYSEKDGLCSNLISTLLIDRKGNFWIGTWGGVCKFHGFTFETFDIPYPTVETMVNPDTKDWITTITEDSNGHIWFGRDGYGASRWDGTTLAHFTTTEGLNSNHVQSIVEDYEGNIWIGTRVAEKDHPDPSKRNGKGGLNRYDGNTVTHFPTITGLSNGDVYGLYQDPSNRLWISTTNHGVYHYQDGQFTHYPVPVPTMTFWSDRNGKVWLGCAGGLYSIHSDGSVINVTTAGPWE